MNKNPPASSNGDREEMCGHGCGRGRTNGESSMETYTVPYVKQSAKGTLLYDLGNSNQGSVTN